MDTDLTMFVSLHYIFVSSGNSPTNGTPSKLLGIWFWKGNNILFYFLNNEWFNTVKSSDLQVSVW